MGTSTRIIIPPKPVGETITITFDFTSLLAASETLSTATMSIAVYSGTDSNPSAVLSGSASAGNGLVTQKVTAGVEGVIYKLKASVTTSASQTLVLSTYLAIISDLP